MQNKRGGTFVVVGLAARKNADEIPATDNSAAHNVGRKVNDIERLEMESVGSFVQVTEQKKTVIATLQRPQGERASPLPIETMAVGNYVALHDDNKGGYTSTRLLPCSSAAVRASPPLEKIGGTYWRGSDGYYVEMGDEIPKRMTDFLIEVRSLEKRLSIDGNSRDYYHLNLIDENGNTHELTILASEWGDLCSRIDREEPLFQIFHDVIPQAGLKFKRLVGLLLKKAHPDEIVVREAWGWGDLDEDGTRQFFHGGRSDCLAKKSLHPIISDALERQRRLTEAWKITEVGPHCVMTPLLLYSMAVYLDAPFTDAGFPLNFSVMLLSDSGFLKTALTEVLYAPCVFPSKKRLHNIRGTEAAMNLLHQELYDDTLVIDDFNLEGTAADVAKKMKLLRASIRDYSDKSAREKYGGEGKVVRYAIRGGFVFSGETRMTGQIRSAELRYLTVRFPCPLDGAKLRVFQGDLHLLWCFASEFVRFVETNYASIVRMVKERVPMMRAQMARDSLRLADALIFLVLTAELVGNFVSENGVALPEVVNGWVGEAREIILDLVQKQEKGANVRDPIVRYVEEVFDLISANKILVASSIEQYLGNIDKYCGYREGGLYMLQRDKAFEFVCSAFAKRNEYLPLSADDVSRMLKEHGLTKCDSNSCLKKASSRIPGRPRMLALIKAACYQKLEELNYESRSSE